MIGLLPLRRTFLVVSCATGPDTVGAGTEFFAGECLGDASLGWVPLETVAGLVRGASLGAGEDFGVKDALEVGDIGSLVEA